MKKVIAFIGFEGSGKDYQTNKILQDKSYTRIGMSDAIREKAFKSCGIKPIYGKEYEKWKISPLHGFTGKTGRDLLLKIGEMQRKINPYVWSEKWLKSANKLFPNNIVVNDCRFWHEVRSILNLSLINGYEVIFIYCNYQGEKFRVSKEKPDQLAYFFHENNFTNNYDITEIVKVMAGYTNDKF